MHGLAANLGFLGLAMKGLPEGAFHFRVWLDDECVVHYPATHLEAACICHPQWFGFSSCISTGTSQLGALSGSRQRYSHVPAPNLSRVFLTSHGEHDKCLVDRRIPGCFRKSLFSHITAAV